MRYITIFLLLTIYFSPFSYTQPVASPDEPVDTIILISGRKVAGWVQQVTTNRISYIPVDKNSIEEMDRKHVHRIQYLTGRVETFNSLAAQMVDEGDWRTIILTDKEEEVDGLYALGVIDAQSSPRSRDVRSAQRSADIRLRKRASNMGGFMVLITKRESKGGYGEVPTHYVEGVVYGFEPPSE